jgi:hypothetical protein
LPAISSYNVLQQLGKVPAIVDLTVSAFAIEAFTSVVSVIGVVRNM